MKARITYAAGTTKIIEIEDAMMFKDFVESDPNIIEAELPVGGLQRKLIEWA